MRLKHIKLAGFKSFVDPTKVPFEQQMTAIVGPNGCGKSNIIDAVRWVLGESSAKNLRGDAMTDVIFNGAASRKPVGQASVELVFDNSQGRIKGNMADRSEVSIRRVVNRDSQNSYFLNGSKCRRRDITDIFLGTGLGPRSYAIIEQGTISRLIESKPHELRVFIEEAAGISKYKERRRETENRIVHTRENLARLADIRSELTLRIDALHKQAEAAKRYRTLKADERKYKAELSVLRWQEYQKKNQHFLDKITLLQAEIEQLVLQQTHHENALFQAKQKLTVGGDNIDDLQTEKLALTNNIARIEQDIKHIHLQKNAQKQESELAQKHLIEDEQKLKTLELELSEKNTELKQLQPELNQCQQQLQIAQLALNEANDKLYQWQQARESYHQQSQLALEKKNSLTAKIDACQQTILVNTQRQEKLETELTKLNSQKSALLSGADLTKEMQALTKQAGNCEQKLIENQHKLEQLQLQLTGHSQKLATEQGLLQAQQQSHQQLLFEQNKLSDWQASQKIWLTKQNLQSQARLFEAIEVSPNWQAAFELVLNDWLAAQQVSNFPKNIDQHLAIETLLLVKNSSASTDIQAQSGTLAAQVTGQHSFNVVLNNIFLADNYQQAQILLSTLTAQQSVICPDTTWLGHGFLRKGFTQESDAQLTKLAYIKQLEVEITSCEQTIATEQVSKATIEAQLADAKQHAQQLKTELNQLKQAVSALQQTITVNEQQQIFIVQQQETLQVELTSLIANLPKAQQQLSEFTQALTQVLTQQPKVLVDENGQDKSLNEQVLLQQSSKLQQQSVNQLTRQQQQLAVQIERATNQQASTQQSQIALQEKIRQAQLLQQQRQVSLTEHVEPLTANEQKLQSWLAQMSSVEGKLSFINDNLAQAQQELIKLEQKKETTNKTITQLKEQVTKQHLEAESYRIRAHSMQEQLDEMQVCIQDIEKQMPVGAKESIWQAYLVKIAKEISHLGAINLAAIAEYEEQLERKNYLEQQNDDLVKAITTLEGAIAKIDKETKQKFKSTFEQVNKDLKSLFPKVFGGGSASLELTGDDLLETGVSIMARPPGKKNSTIHLLSGGEKALTALSLVFAIFRLNPAPFCMLDEVDAPLDDANVERFCNLVREMSQTVQFVYISHNKIAMEMASQLTGVTMFEPGVSRMVAVDIDEAIAMADVS